MGHYVLLLLLLQLFVVVAPVIRIERLWKFKLNTYILANMVTRGNLLRLRPDLIRNKVDLEKRQVKLINFGKVKEIS